MCVYNCDYDIKCEANQLILMEPLVFVLKCIGVMIIE